jgi:hypothetical protein
LLRYLAGSVKFSVIPIRWMEETRILKTHFVLHEKERHGRQTFHFQ